MKNLFYRPALRRMTLAALALLSAMPGAAFAQSCQDLWVERNTYYKEAGFCFKTDRAISYFGNGGCSYDSEWDVPLSQSTRARIEDIKRAERRYGCR